MANDDDYFVRRSRLLIYAGGVIGEIVYVNRLGIFMKMSSSILIYA